MIGLMDGRDRLLEETIDSTGELGRLLCGETIDSMVGPGRLLGETGSGRGTWTGVMIAGTIGETTDAMTAVTTGMWQLPVSASPAMACMLRFDRTPNRRR